MRGVDPYMLVAEMLAPSSKSTLAIVSRSFRAGKWSGVNPNVSVAETSAPPSMSSRAAA